MMQKKRKRNPWTKLFICSALPSRRNISQRLEPQNLPIDVSKLQKVSQSLRLYKWKFSVIAINFIRLSVSQLQNSRSSSTSRNSSSLDAKCRLPLSCTSFIIKICHFLKQKVLFFFFFSIIVISRRKVESKLVELGFPSGFGWGIIISSRSKSSASQVWGVYLYHGVFSFSIHTRNFP